MAGKVAGLKQHQEGFLGQPAQRLTLKGQQKREGTLEMLTGDETKSPVGHVDVIVMLCHVLNSFVATGHLSHPVVLACDKPQ